MSLSKTSKVRLKLAGGCKLSLYTDKSCNSHAGFFVAMIKSMHHVHHLLLFGNDVISHTQGEE